MRGFVRLDYFRHRDERPNRGGRLFFLFRLFRFLVAALLSFSHDIPPRSAGMEKCPVTHMIQLQVIPCRRVGLIGQTNVVPS